MSSTTNSSPTGLITMIVCAFVGGYLVTSSMKSKSVAVPTVVKQTAPMQSATPSKPELTEEQKKQKDFDAERTARALVLEAAIKKSAYDPDSLKINRPVYYKNGVCVAANGKNRFGGYVGFKDYCYLIDENGKWYIQE